MSTQSRVNVFDVPVDPLQWPDLLQRVEDAIRLNRRTRIMYVNVHCLNVSRRNRAYRRILNRADTVYCDGTGVVWGARLLGQTLPGRMTGADWIIDLCAHCEQAGYGLYLLGGEPGTAEGARNVLCERFKRLRIVGTQHGFFHAHEAPEVIASITRAKPDILLVGMGTPVQEQWIDSYGLQLDVPVVWAMGAVMDFVTAKVPRAPRWMLDHGLEWLYRFMIEPKRLWRRYLLGNTIFVLRVLWARLARTFHKHLGEIT